jgi:hypothetical protein
MTYHSPKYWKEMARLRKEHEAQLQKQATSNKPQAGFKRQAQKATSSKHQAPSKEVQVPSHKQQA